MCYMPCDNRELYASILGSLSDHIINKDISVDHYIVAGDFNCSFYQSSPVFDVFHSFTDLCMLTNALQNTVDRNTFTYRHKKLESKSCIDYIFVSSVLNENLLSGVVQDSGLNMSDHVPVV